MVCSVLFFVPLVRLIRFALIHNKMKALKIGNLLAPVPIVQGGMGVGISLAGLASAVADQGGIGVISSAGLGVIYKDYSKDYRTASIWGLKQELKKAREATKGIVGVNVMVAMSNFADMVRTAIAEKADIIFSGAGLPLNLPSFLTEGAKTKLAPIVSSARAAKLLCQKWFAEYKYIPDAIVVEGPKAGGHLGYKEEQLVDEHYALESIVPEIVAEVHAFEAEHGCHIPVIAGGGIYTGEDIYRIMSLGAEGVQCGTRFLTVEECSVHEAWKEKVLKAKDSDTIVTGRGTGHPVRGLKNKFARECRKIEMAATSGEELEGMYAGSLARAVAGDVENGSVMAGQVAALVTERGTAAGVIADMVREAEALAGRSLDELAELNSRRARV